MGQWNRMLITIKHEAWCLSSSEQRQDAVLLDSSSGRRSVAVRAERLPRTESWWVHVSTPGRHSGGEGVLSCGLWSLKTPWRVQRFVPGGHISALAPWIRHLISWDLGL